MVENLTEWLFLCPNCFMPGEKEGPCTQCGTQVLKCRPGDPDDPCRRPLMDDHGRVRSRAPLWWLQRKVTRLMEYMQRE
jgi:hypothetical protein